jgi:GNAT superfamily N-acetyltransferase
MIRELSELTPYLDFIRDVNGDPCFSDPMLCTPGELEQNLLRAVGKPNDRVLGVFRDGTLVGLFDFLILPDEKYVEMIAGLSREAAVYEEILDRLAAAYPGFQADFVFNPENRPLRALLEKKGAAFDPVQHRMVFSGPLPAVDTAGVELFSEPYRAQYLALHGSDAYWTGEKVLAAPERFRVLLAVEAGAVVGYLDVTHCFEENEPFDLFVREGSRRRGWGARLMAKALEMNRPNGMMLLVDKDNAAAIRLYEKLGFAAQPGQDSLTAFWRIGEATQ